MMGTKTTRGLRPSAFLKAMLLSTAALTPAFAQDAAEEQQVAQAATGSEEITVTAQRGGAAQSVQKIPIAVTAISGKELEAKSIESFKDLQFSVPSVTYSNGNFGGNNFQIRGIGISAVATSADSGVSIHTNDVYNYGTAGLATAEYYDLERIEVLRGPQSTLYGRNATGGVVNVITAKANPEDTFFHADATYGEYNMAKVNLMANIPLIENELAIRIAGNYTRHDGFVENLYTGNNINSQNIKQVRASLRWQPTDSTTLDLIGSYSFEKDSRMRYPKQLCHRDPTGVMGCLPDKLAYEPVNSFATFGTLISSQQTLGPALGLFNVLAPGTAGGNALSPVPNDNLKVFTDFEPTFRGDGEFYMASLEQELTDWLTVTALVNHSRGESSSTSHYNNLVGDDITARLAQIAATLPFIPGGQTYLNTFFRRPDGTLGLPVSIPETGGITAGPVEGKTVLFSDRVLGSDLIGGSGKQDTVEIRFNSDFDGPFNFLLAGFYIKAESDATYYVNANTLDYAGALLGLLTAYLPAGATGTPLVLAPTQFRSNTRLNSLESRAIFGEVYYDVTDDLKITAGMRWTEDQKQVIAQTTLFNFVAPLGSTEADIDRLLGNSAFDADPSKPGRQVVQDQSAKFSQVTGRLVVEWTPDLDFTDETLIYGSYARGYKSGGINPPVSEGLFAVPTTFKPEQINAYEIGTKNRFMDNRLQVNLTGYYYDYIGYQISDIIARTSVNSNIDATVWGLEGEFMYRPDDNWQFSLVATHTNTEIGDAAIVDQRNPTAGIPNAVMVKDTSSGANCVILMSAAANGLTPGQAGVPGFFVPPNGGAQSLAQYGVPNVNFGSCNSPFLNPLSPAFNPTLASQYSYAPDGSGIRVNIKGNELPQQPNNTIAFGVQYTTEVSTGYELVLRGDYYWQGEMWTRIINSDPVDKIKSWDVLNLSVQLNAVDQGWYARVFATNVLDSRELTNSYLTDASSGLFTNIFVQDPRVIGLTVGIDF
jgi:outer membrane receptor protein involved in Fe transport